MSPRAPSNVSTQREVLDLAWPVMFSMGLATLYSLVDAFWVGRLGPDALAAVAPAQFASWILWAVGSVLSMGIPSLVARAIGSGDHRRASTAATAGLQLSLVIGVLTALSATRLSGFIFGFVGAPAEVSEMGASYLNILLWGSTSIYFFMAGEAVLRASGDTRTPMFIATGTLLLNFVLDPLLILGPGPFPRWGVPGAAIASIIAHVVAAIFFGFYFARPGKRFTLRWYRPDREAMRLWGRIARIGLPGGFNAALFTIVYVVLSKIAAQIGTVPLAVLGVGNRLESINYLIATGFEVAASTLVGQALGRGDHKRASRVAWTAGAYSMAFTGITGLLFYLFPEFWFRLFSDDPATVAEGARFLRIVAISQIWMGLEIAIFGGFTGAGNTVPPTAISVVISIARIPLAWWFAFPLGWGATGVWWMISSTSILRGLLLALWFRRNRWQQTKVW